MRYFLPALTALHLLLAAVPVRAALTLDLDPQPAYGMEAVISGELTNTSPTDKLFLNDVQLTLAGASATHLTLRSNTFFSNVPGILLPGESYSGPLFAVAVGAAAPAASYPGSVTLAGGADQQAATPLATAGFSVSSPAVSVTAVDAEASEFNPSDTATFTITRTGGTTAALVVPFTLSGDALPAHYSLPASPATLPAGASSVSLTLTAVPNATVEGIRTVALSLAGLASPELGFPASASVMLLESPVDLWRFQKFGAAGAATPRGADDGDWDADGWDNLLEYSLGTDPLIASATPPPSAALVNGYLTLQYVPDPSVVDIAFTVESSTNLVTWSTTDIEPAAIAGPPGSVAFRYKHLVGSSTSPRVFLQLRVARAPAPP